MKLIIDIDEKTKNLVDSRKSLPLSSIIELEKVISCGIPLDNLRAEIEQIEINGYVRDVECFNAGINTALNVINKYKAERSE